MVYPSGSVPSSGLPSLAGACSVRVLRVLLLHHLLLLLLVRIFILTRKYPSILHDT